jgi:hypothetical protein
MAPFAVVVLMYKVDASFPIALLTVAGSVGQIIMPHIFRILLDDFHWSGAFIILAGIALQGFPCGILIHYSKDIVDRSGENNVTSAIFDKKLCMDRVVWLYLLDIILIVSTGKILKNTSIYFFCGIKNIWNNGYFDKKNTYKNTKI